MRYTSVTSLIVMVTLQPLFSFARSYFFFHERYGGAARGGCLIAVAGCATVGWGTFKSSGRALLGDEMALLACGVIVGYFLIGQHVRKSFSAVPYSILGYASSAGFLLLYSLLRGEALLRYPAKTWLCFLGLAFVSTLLGQIIFNWLLRWLSRVVISMVILGKTIGTCILSYCILGERIAAKQGIGIALILFGLGIFLYHGKAIQSPAPLDRANTG